MSEEFWFDLKQSKKFIFSSMHPDWLWSSLSLLSMGTRC